MNHIQLVTSEQYPVIIKEAGRFIDKHPEVLYIKELMKEFMPLNLIKQITPFQTTYNQNTGLEYQENFMYYASVYGVMPMTKWYVGDKEFLTENYGEPSANTFDSSGYTDQANKGVNEFRLSYPVVKIPKHLFHEAMGMNAALGGVFNFNYLVMGWKIELHP